MSLLLLLLLLLGVPLNTRAEAVESGEEGIVARETRKYEELNDSDFVIAIPCATGKRLLIGHATRCWRRGIRTLIAINGSEQVAQKLTDQYSQEHNEFYEYAPDDGQGYWGNRSHGRYPGDPRSALSPMLAHRRWKGEYKWLLHGDDDTIFFVQAAKSMLKDFDHMGLLAFTDRVWFKERCIPCSFDLNNPPTGDTRGFGPSPVKALNSTEFPKACPFCNRTLFCVDGKCPRVQRNYGGGGVIFSRGLMEYLDSNNAYLNCLNNSFLGGSDHLVSECLWNLDIGFIDPGFIAAHGGDERFRAFMPQWPNPGDHHTTPLSKLVGGTCDYLCKWRIRNQVTHHLKVRSLPSPDSAAAMLVSIVAQYSAAYDLLNAMADSEADGSALLDGNLSSWE